MKWTLLLALLVLDSAAAFQYQHHNAGKHKHVVLIVADDLGNA